MMRVLLCLAGLFAIVASHTCPPLWTNGPNGCYRVFSTPKTWNEARQHCLSFSSCGAEGGLGDLAIIPSPQVNEFLVSLRGMSILIQPAASLWVGGTDQGQEGNWRWASGKVPFTQYRNWAQGQPNNQANNEHCMIFPSARSINQWDDFDCNTQLPYACQMYESDLPPQQTPGQGGRPQFMWGRPNPAQIAG